MSYTLLSGEDTIHTAHHDLESFYWTLLWIALRYTGHDYKPNPWQPDPCARAYRIGNDEEAASAKAHWIIGRKLRITFTGNKPLTDLMHDFRMLIWQRTVAHPYEQEPQYLTHAAVLELLDKALARSNEWPDAKSEGSKAFVRPHTVSVHLDQPKRHAEQDAEDSESTAKRSRRQSKKENGTATGDPFESTSNPQLTTVKGSSRGSRGRAGGDSKTRGSEKQQS